MVTTQGFICILVYVDDLLIIGSDNAMIAKTKEYLHSTIHIKDLGTLKYFLGLEIARNNTGICLHQRKYTLDIIKDTGLTNAKPSAIPIE